MDCLSIRVVLTWWIFWRQLTPPGFRGRNTLSGNHPCHNFPLSGSSGQLSQVDSPNGQ